MDARLTGFRGRSVVSAAAVLLLLVNALAGTAGSAHDDDHTASAMLARTSAGYLSDLQPLDPRTLADKGDQLTAENDEMFEPGTMIVSNDGKTIAGLSLTNEIVVEDMASRSVIARIDPQGSVAINAIKTDGSQILASVNADYSAANLQTPAWKVFDVTTGAMTAAIQSDPTQSNWGNFAVDPVLWQMYQLQEGDTRSEDTFETEPAKLVAFDLATGHLSGQVDLPDVRMGTWMDESQGEETMGEPLFVSRMPGIAISPDGRQLAIVHVTDDGITLIDATALKVERTLTMKPKASLFDRFFALLPLAPRIASAKMVDLTDAGGTYAADGTHLYVYGDDERITADEQEMHGHGISLVDLKDGTIEAHALDGIAIDQILTLPGEKGIYLAGTDYSKYSPSAGAPYLIAHLDDSLNVLATRELPAYAILMALPMPQTS